MSTTPVPSRPGPPDIITSGGPWAIRFRAHPWRMLVAPRRTGVHRLREATLYGPWLELGSTGGRWRWRRGTVDVACSRPPRASWTRALPVRMLLVAPRPSEPADFLHQTTDAAQTRALVFDCAGLTTTEFTQLHRHVRLFTESALLRGSMLRPSLEDGRFWERLPPASTRKLS